MKYYLVIILLTGLIFSQSGENQSFKLQDGTVVVGLIIEETETTFIIQTKYGAVTLNKDELVRTEYEIKSQLAPVDAVINFASMMVIGGIVSSRTVTVTK